eukprot:2578783-Rhodomonas_salina.4
MKAQAASERNASLPVKAKRTHHNPSKQSKNWKRENVSLAWKDSDLPKPAWKLGKEGKRK